MESRPDGSGSPPAVIEDLQSRMDDAEVAIQSIRTPEMEELRARLEEAEEAIRAIRGGEVDALVVTGPGGERVYTIEGADLAYRHLFEQMSEGAVVLDAGGIILFGNGRLGEMLARPMNHVVGSALAQYVSPVDQEALGRLLDRGRRGVSQEDFRLVEKDGGRIPVHASMAPFESGGLEACCLILTDLSSRFHIEQGMREARIAADSANLAKGQFLANMSHEIRTPMNAICGLTELTLATELDAEQRENLELVQAATRSLLSIIDDILDFSKIEAGGLELTSIEFELRQHLADTLALLALPAHAKGLELILRVDPNLPDWLVGDPGRLRQILVNLVNNAIKFTARGEVAVDVDLAPSSKGADDVALHFRVADTGIGIPAERRAAIFDPFTQADGSTTRRYGGTGLGLTISSQLVGMMRGRLWVESEVGRGSTFHFLANFGRPQVSRFTNPAASDEILDGRRVLVVDCTPVDRRALEQALRRWKMEPTLVDGDHAAQARLREAREAAAPFSLVFVDPRMPEVDGLTLAERLLADPALKDSLLLMQARPPRPHPDHRRSAGEIRIGKGTSAVCLDDPLDETALKAAIHAVLDQRPRVDDGPAPAPPLVPPSLHILMAEDNLFNQRVARLMLIRSGHTVSAVVDGLQAIAALDREAFDLVLMDLQMPEMDGLQATLAIRSAEAGTARHVPIIALTAHAMKEDRDRCLGAGMDAYLSKPIQQVELDRAIYECITRVRGPAATLAEASPMDLDAALRRIDGDRGFLADMAAIFIAECPALLAQIRAALARRDPKALIIPAHTLKNWAGNFVATTLFAQLADLEASGRDGTMAASYPGLEGELERLVRLLSELHRAPASAPSLQLHPTAASYIGRDHVPT